MKKTTKARPSPIFLEDLANLSESQIKDHIANAYNTKRKPLDQFNILVAYESVGDWGCDSSSFFLIQDKKTEKLLINYGSHCSCYGFEDQWDPKPTTIKYLQSELFHVSLGGYDNTPKTNEEAIKKYVKKL